MRKLASDIGMSEANLHRCVNNNKIQASDLEKIAKLLNVDIRLFFEKEFVQPSVTASGDGSVAVSGNNNSHIASGGDTALLQERVKHLEELLAEKERLISVLMEERK